MKPQLQKTQSDKTIPTRSEHIIKSGFVIEENVAPSPKQKMLSLISWLIGVLVVLMGLATYFLNTQSQESAPEEN